MKHLTKEKIFSVASERIGNYHIQDKGQLCYLVDKVSSKVFGVERYPTITQKAAAYLHYIATCHPFVDGNKRVAVGCATSFLEDNGYLLRHDIRQSAFELAIKVACKCITDIEAISKHIQSWIV